MAFTSQADAKKNFLQLVRGVATDRTRVYVCTKANIAYMTLDPIKRNMATPAVPMSAQRFKNHFSRCSALIQSGMAFELSVRGSNRVVYARRHTTFEDPLEDVVRAWHTMIADATMRSEDNARIIDFLRRMEENTAEDRSALRDDVQKLVLGIARLAIGHAPFKEGQAEGGARVIDGP